MKTNYLLFATVLATATGNMIAMMGGMPGATETAMDASTNNGTISILPNQDTFVAIHSGPLHLTVDNSGPVSMLQDFLKSLLPSQQCIKDALIFHKEIMDIKDAQHAAPVYLPAEFIALVQEATRAYAGAQQPNPNLLAAHLQWALAFACALNPELNNLLDSHKLEYVKNSILQNISGLINQQQAQELTSTIAHPLAAMKNAPVSNGGTK